jgi:hypothetical protein
MPLWPTAAVLPPPPPFVPHMPPAFHLQPPPPLEFVPPHLVATPAFGVVYPHYCQWEQ